MNFFKTVLASALGFIISWIVVIVLGTVLLFSILMAVLLAKTRRPLPTVSQDSFLVLNLQGELMEYSRDSETLDISSLLYDDKEDVVELGLSLDEIQKALNIAAYWNNVKGLYIQAGNLECGAVTAQEILNSISDFKKHSGKPVYAYIDQMASQHSYMIATTADSIFINPMGAIALHGYGVSPLFYTGAFKKAGIEPQVFKVGTFKSAVEPYTETQMSSASRMQAESYLSDMWKSYTDIICENRALTTGKINMLADKYADLMSADEYVENGLVDSVCYETDVLSFLGGRSKLYKIRDFLHKARLNLHRDNFFIDNKEDYMIASYSYDSLNSPVRFIAVLYAAGQIYDSPTPSGLLYGGKEEIVSSRLVRNIEKLKADTLIEAVVLRINSPGGSAYASEQIWHAVSELNKVKPVVVSMGDFAASGGYYIAAGASKIVASPSTLTGSIGIFGITYSAEKLAEKVGLSADCVKTNRYTDLGSLMRSMTPAEKNLMQSYVNRGYKTFVERCSQGRGISRESIEKIAQGRVWSGSKAVEIGLADTLGTLNTAIELAARLAGDTTLGKRVVRYPFKKTNQEKLSEFVDEFKTMNLNMSAKKILENKLLELKRNSGIMAVMPQMIQE